MEQHVGTSDIRHIFPDRISVGWSPEYWIFDLGATLHAGRFETHLQLLNLADNKANAGGYTDGTARYFYPVASRNMLMSLKMTF